MIKVEVTKNNISILGHANFAEYGQDIVCASVSSIIMTSVESVAAINSEAIDIKQELDKLEIIINSHDDITDKLINTMLTLLSELEKKYPKNIKITNKEE